MCFVEVRDLAFPYYLGQISASPLTDTQGSSLSSMAVIEDQIILTSLVVRRQDLLFLVR
jgi:hypothetical protein